MSISICEKASSQTAINEKAKLKNKGFELSTY